MKLIIAVLILASAAAAQETSFRSFVKTDAALISVDAAAKIADGIYTRRLLEGKTIYQACFKGVCSATTPYTWHVHGTELNPLARPFVQSNGGAAAYFAAAFAGDVSAAYFLQKHGHSKWAKAALGFGVGYSVEGAAQSAHAFYYSLHF